MPSGEKSSSIESELGLNLTLANSCNCISWFEVTSLKVGKLEGEFRLFPGASNLSSRILVS